MEHIPAIHAAKVGMRYPARMIGYLGYRWDGDGCEVELDLSALAPGRSPTLRADLRYSQTVRPVFAKMLAPGHRFEIVLIEVDRENDWLLASLPADPSWLTWNNGTVRHLARRIRETGETILLPVLADALEEAGCTDTALLDHCRRPTEDAPGWVVELLATQE